MSCDVCKGIPHIAVVFQVGPFYFDWAVVDLCGECFDWFSKICAGKVYLDSEIF
jgi:hypothetical protein